MPPILGTLIYAFRDNSLLLMERNKPPNFGLWVGPGGKVEASESPYECALRELREETGLIAPALRFRGLITEVSPRPDWHWLLFIYLAPQVEGELIGDEREGKFRWWPLHQVLNASMPEADRAFLPLVLDESRPLVQGRYVYDNDLKLIKVIHHPTPD